MNSPAPRAPSFSSPGRAAPSVAVNLASSVRTDAATVTPGSGVGSGAALSSLRSGVSDADNESTVTRKSLVGQPPSFAPHFRRYELMVEFMSLRNPKHCPPGLYVMPSIDNPDVWFGVCFIDKGYYKGAVFKFKLTIPEDYPCRSPSITFVTDVFHPLTDPNGRFYLKPRFSKWEAHRDHLFHVLRYMRDAFRRSALDRLIESQCPNREALQMYKNEPSLFAKLAEQCSDISTKDSILYDNYPESNSICFARMTDVKQEEARKRMLESVPTTGKSGKKKVQDALNNIRSAQAGMKP